MNNNVSLQNRTTRFIDLNSTFRDRQRFPKPCDFTMTFARKSGNEDSLTAVDGVSNGEPTIQGEIKIATLGTNIVVSEPGTAGSLPDNFGVGCYIRLIDAKNNPELIKIVSFDNASSTFTLESNISITPVTGPGLWVIYANKPLVYTGECDYKDNIVTLAVPFATDVFTGNYFRLQADDVGVRSRIIRSFSSPTTLDVFGLTGSDMSVRYEIIAFNYDNDTSISYNGPLSNQTQRISYNVQLKNLTIPLAPLKNKRGGNIYDYPFVYVRFGNTDAMVRDTLWTNNPNKNVRGSLFRVPVDSADENNTNFCTFRCDMEQVIKFKPADNMSFSVYLDDGTLLEFMDDDNLSPALPVPTLQVSAIFSITPIS